MSSSRDEAIALLETFLRGLRNREFTTKDVMFSKMPPNGGPDRVMLNLVVAIERDAPLASRSLGSKPATTFPAFVQEPAKAEPRVFGARDLDID